MASLIYPRTVSISRPIPLSGVGDQGYSAVTKGNETPVASGLPANIQQDRQRGTPEGGTPTATPNASGWVIFIPAGAAANGLIRERDVATDDLGKRYVVIAAYWNVLGYKLITELLEA